MAETKIEVGPNKAVQQLKLLRDLTQRTGILSEIQCHQLRCWPSAVINAKESTCAFNYDKKTVKFTLTGFIGDVEPDRLPERLEHLEKCVHFLLGNEYGVSVYVGKKCITAQAKAEKIKKKKENAKPSSDREVDK